MNIEPLKAAVRDCKAVGADPTRKIDWTKLFAMLEKLLPFILPLIVGKDQEKAAAIEEASAAGLKPVLQEIDLLLQSLLKALPPGQFATLLQFGDQLLQFIIKLLPDPIPTPQPFPPNPAPAPPA